MDYLHVLLVVIIVGMGVWIFRLSSEKKEVEVARREAEEEWQAAFAKASASQGGLAEYNQKMQEKKDLALAKILEIMNPPSHKASEGQVSRSKISNRDVAKGLGVSSATAVRYLDELEAEGKIKQVGKTGHYTYYIKA